MVEKAITFEKNSVLDSYFIHKRIIIKGQVRFRVKATNCFWSYGPLSMLKKIVEKWFPFDIF